MENLTLIVAEWQGRVTVDGEMVPYKQGHIGVGNGTDWVIINNITGLTLIISSEKKIELFGE